MNKALIGGAIVVALFAIALASHSGASTLAVVSGVPVLLIVFAALISLASTITQIVGACKTKAGKVAATSALILPLALFFGMLGWLMAVDLGLLPNVCIELESGGAWCAKI